MAVYVGRTVVHRAAVNRSRTRGLTACGLPFALPDVRYMPQGVFDDADFVEWVRDLGFDVQTCFQCANREPAWQRRRRQRDRRKA